MAAFRLQENIDKYMKFMEFIRSSSPLTLRHYLLDLKQAFGMPIDLLSPPMFPKVIAEAEMLRIAKAAFSGPWLGLSLASRNRKAATLKSFFGWAYSENLTEKDLATQITCPKVPKRIPHFLSVDEMLSVMKTLNDEDLIHSQGRVLFLLLYGGGLRVSEACALQWKNIQYPQRTLRVLGKGGKERVIVLPKLCITALKQLQNQQNASFVFGEKPMNTRKAYEIIKQQGIKADLIQPLHPHALRHSFATHLLSSGANLRTLQEMLGHESLQATEKYTHLGIDQLARTIEQMHPLGRGKKTG